MLLSICVLHRSPNDIMMLPYFELCTQSLPACDLENTRDHAFRARCRIALRFTFLVIVLC